MNCECFYVVKDGTLEKARTLAKDIERLAMNEELYVCAISQAKQEFKANSEYDGYGRTYKVASGSWLVFVQGKYHAMCSIRPKGGKRGFPMFDYYSDYIQDVEEVE